MTWNLECTILSREVQGQKLNAGGQYSHDSAKRWTNLISSQSTGTQSLGPTCGQLYSCVQQCCECSPPCTTRSVKEPPER